MGSRKAYIFIGGEREGELVRYMGDKDGYTLDWTGCTGIPD